MTLVGYLLYFILASFSGYFLNADRTSKSAQAIFLATPVGGWFLLGWPAMLAFLPAAVVGSMAYWYGPTRREGDTASMRCLTPHLEEIDRAIAEEQHAHAKLPPPPKRSDFATDEAFEEARDRWSSTVGRIHGMADQSRRSMATRLG
jgi:hypothetical protein